MKKEEVPIGVTNKRFGHTQVRRTNTMVMYTGSLNKKYRRKVHRLSCEKRMHVGNLMVGPWYLV